MYRLRLVLAFAAIYFVWGSTYLAIRYAVEAVPPLTVAGVRHLLAGATLLLVARGRGARATRSEWAASLLLGALFFLIGHGSLHWAEQVVPSGLAALIIATEPLWIALLLVAPPFRARLTGREVAGLVVGLLGVAVLGQSDIVRLSRAHLIGALAILGGAISWALGVLWAARGPLPADPLLRTATTLLAGAGLLLGAAVLVGEPARWSLGVPGLAPLLAWAYLVVGGSLVAYPAYLWLLDRCSPTLVATHTFVNPLVALLLGWAVADEPLTPSMLAASGLILVAVVLVGVGSARPAEPVDTPAVAGPHVGARPCPQRAARATEACRRRA